MFVLVPSFHDKVVECKQTVVLVSHTMVRTLASLACRYDNEAELLADIDEDEDDDPVMLSDDEDTDGDADGDGAADEDDDDEQIYDFGDFFDPFNRKMVRTAHHLHSFSQYLLFNVSAMYLICNTCDVCLRRQEMRSNDHWAAKCRC